MPGLVVNGGETTAGAGVWSTDMPEGQDAAACRMSPLENKSVSLEQGTAYKHVYTLMCVHTHTYTLIIYTSNIIHILYT